MIYLVEDDDSIRDLVVYTLNNSGLEARGFSKGKDFWPAVKAALPALVLLDIMLPGEDGLSILKRLRSSAATAALPVIMLTARGTEYDKVLGLDSGADDYLAKPFGMMEMVARVRSLMRRTTAPEPEKDNYSLGGVVVNIKNHSVSVNGTEAVLTPKEFDLLVFLLKNGDTVVSRRQLLQEVWGYDFVGETRTVDTHILTLRGKLGECGGIIQTVRGIGYKTGKAL
ncbi:MAG: response regulator transcription factor [Treponema sp.]|jgi:two-component system alkaline phosphatase synthesis response regulator PhoP|nr:response regulator transcription factor [Treponema sp.]